MKDMAAHFCEVHAEYIRQCLLRLTSNSMNEAVSAKAQQGGWMQLKHSVQMLTALLQSVSNSHGATCCRSYYTAV